MCRQVLLGWRCAFDVGLFRICGQLLATEPDRDGTRQSAQHPRNRQHLKKLIPAHEDGCRPRVGHIRQRTALSWEHLPQNGLNARRGGLNVAKGKPEGPSWTLRCRRNWRLHPDVIRLNHQQPRRLQNASGQRHLFKLWGVALSMQCGEQKPATIFRLQFVLEQLHRSLTLIIVGSFFAASIHCCTALGLSATGNSHHVSHSGCKGLARHVGTCRDACNVTAISHWFPCHHRSPAFCRCQPEEDVRSTPKRMHAQIQHLPRPQGRRPSACAGCG